MASRKLKAGTRYYYIDAKLDSKGNKYIVLSETKLARRAKVSSSVTVSSSTKRTSRRSQRPCARPSSRSPTPPSQAMSPLPPRQAPRTLTTREATTEGLHDEDLQLQSFDIEWTDEA